MTVIDFKKDIPVELKYTYVKYFDLECTTGYGGPNCTLQCPYPTYGDRCEKDCDCIEYLCDVSTGCSKRNTSR